MDEHNAIQHAWRNSSNTGRLSLSPDLTLSEFWADGYSKFLDCNISSARDGGYNYFLDCNIPSIHDDGYS